MNHLLPFLVFQQRDHQHQHEPQRDHHFVGSCRSRCRGFAEAESALTIMVMLTIMLMLMIMSVLMIMLMIMLMLMIMPTLISIGLESGSATDRQAEESKV